MTEWGRYRVTGTREYRGEAPGQEFVARLERRAEGRAILRGDITLIGRVLPELPVNWGVPDGRTRAGKE